MKTYIGVKVIQAEPALSPVTEGAEQRGGYRVQYPDGYISWSPKDVFEEAYREVSDADAESILLGARAEIERLANGGALFDAIGSQAAEAEQRSIRMQALHLAAGTFRDAFSIEQLLFRAVKMAAYVETGASEVAPS